MKALVLGGGGVTGVAWEIGVLAALNSAGVGVASADVLVGTSAGSVVAALVGTGIDLERAYERQVANAPAAEIGARMGVLTLAGFVWAALRGSTRVEVARRIGKMALKAKTAHEDERKAVIASRLPVKEWPAARVLKITGVEAETGEPVVFDAQSGVPLVDAVAASCAVPGVWPPVTINGRRYMDGGIGSAVNLHLAEGCDRVLVVAPLVRGLGRLPSAAAEARALEAKGAKVQILSPDPQALRAIGRNLLDPARRPAAAREGRRQGEAAVEAVRALLS